MKSVHFTQLMRRINEIESLLTLDATTVNAYAFDVSASGIFYPYYKLSPFTIYNKVRAVEAASPFTETQHWGSTGSGDGQLTLGIASIIFARLALLGGEVYLFDAGNYRVQVFSEAGVSPGKWGSDGGGSRQFWYQLSIRAVGSEIYTCDQFGHVSFRPKTVQVFDTNGNFQRSWTTSLPSPNEANGLAMDFDVGTLSGTTRVVVPIFHSTGANSNILRVYSTTGVEIASINTLAAGPRSCCIHDDEIYLLANGTVYVYTAGLSLDRSWAATSGSWMRVYDGEVFVGTSSGTINVYDTVGNLDRTHTPEIGTAALSQTIFYHLSKDGSQTSLGTPDGGVNVPAINAIYQGISGSESQRVRVPGTYILQCRVAIERIVALGAIENPKTGNPYTRDDGDITDNVHYIAMNALMRDYGLAGETLYSWARPIQTDFVDYYDVDIGELWRVVEVLYDAARQQGLL